ncbi:MAG: rhomboid family intramembrane serine protease [Sporichthyaceae bacterium]
MNRRIPLVTFALIALNALVYLLGPSASAQALPAGTSSECAQAVFAQRYGAVPRELSHNQTLTVEAAAEVDGRVVSCPAPEFEKSPPVSALTSMFVHAGLVHLLGNMLLLLVVGCAVERHMGSLGFALFYLVCGYTAAYGFAFTVPNDTAPLIGASGAIAGVLAAHVWLRPREWLLPVLALPFLVPVPGPAWLVGAPGGNVAYVAHAVGAAVGLILALVWFGARPERAGSARTARDHATEK